MARIFRFIVFLIIILTLTCCNNKLPVNYSGSFNFNDTIWRNNNGIRSITATASTPEFLFAGTPNGLFRINRKDNSTVRIKKLAEFNVRYIIYQKNDLIQLNDGIYYNFGTDEVTGIYKQDNIIEVRQKGDLILLLTKDKKLRLINAGDSLNILNYTGGPLSEIIIDGNNVWIPGDLRQGISRYDLTTKQVESIPIGYDFRNYSLGLNDSMIIMTNDEGIIQLNRSGNHDVYLINKEGKRVNISILISEERPFFKYVSDELTRHTGDFRSSYNKYSEIESKYSRSKNSRILQKIDELKISLADLLPYNYRQSLEMSQYITDTLKDQEITAAYYFHLVEMAIYEGKLAEALHYDSILMREFPSHRNNDHILVMDKVKQTSEYISGINKSGVPADQKQWEKSRALYDLFLEAGPTKKDGEVNLTYPFAELKKLKREYPSSQFCDNVDYLILSYIEESAVKSKDEALYLKVMNEYNALITKYPHSELIPDFLNRLALMNYRYPFDIAQKNKFLKAAQSTVKEIEDKYPGYYNDNRLTELNSAISKALEYSEWEFRVKAPKKILRSGEPVYIFFSLTNTGTSSKSLPLFSDTNIPNFIVTVDRYGLYGDFLIEHLTFQPDFSLFNKTFTDSVIAPGMVYEQSIDLLTKCRNSFEAPPGRFVLPAESRYKITATPVNSLYGQYIRPATIWITITNKD